MEYKNNRLANTPLAKTKSPTLGPSTLLKSNISDAGCTRILGITNIRRCRSMLKIWFWSLKRMYIIINIRKQGVYVLLGHSQQVGRFQFWTFSLFVKVISLTINQSIYCHFFMRSDRSSFFLSVSSSSHRFSMSGIMSGPFVYFIKGSSFFVSCITHPSN